MAKNKQEKLQKLQDKYISQLPEKNATLNSTWLKALHNNDTLELHQLRQLAHNLAGSAGTFGFPSISIQAKNIEDTLHNLGVTRDLNDDAKITIHDALKNITRLIEQGPDNLFNCTHASIKYDQVIPKSEFDRLVYVIEDDALLASEIASQLSYFDYEVETFSIVSDAMKAIKKRLPTSMVIDIQLPEGELAGPEFAILFNEFSSTHVPSIFISARDDWTARLATVRANGSAYLTKPLDFNDLLERLDLLTMKHVPEPYKILIVDDMKVLAEHYSLVLQDSGMQVEVVTDINNLLEVLSDFKPELILMDIIMPQCSGLEAAKIIRQKEELLSVPIVFLSTESNPLRHISAMELGGDDFLQKPIADDRLIVAVRTRAQRFRKLRSHMHRDGLTGLLNHVTIKTLLDSEIARAQRQQEPLSFAMLDIDHFKQVNDTYGHPAGDRVIKSLARMLKQRFRKSDLIGRYGGEEFAIILPDTNIDTARTLLDNVRDNFSQIVQQSKKNQFKCTLSAGVTQLTPNSSLDDLIKTADDALYSAKNSGRNSIRTN